MTTGNIITIDVGGQIFRTFYETIKQSGFFRNIIENCSNVEPIFVDRSPKGFNHILQFLRSSDYKVPATYKEDLDYYDIPYKKHNIFYDAAYIYQHELETIEFSSDIIKFLETHPEYVSSTGIKIIVRDNSCTYGSTSLIKNTLAIIDNIFPNMTVRVNYMHYNTCDDHNYKKINYNWGSLLGLKDELEAKILSTKTSV